MSAISGAFSGKLKDVGVEPIQTHELIVAPGLIAFGVFHIKHSKYKGWQFLFWIEGDLHSP